MTSPQHARWIRSGMQWSLARPLVALRDRLRRYGYTVYDLGDTRHLDHIPPEDHTPYSETGWPGTTPYGWVTAIDIMPEHPAGLPSLQQLGRQLVDDRQANVPGVAWIKYINWGPVNDRSAQQDRWMPNHVKRSSSDVGHIHLSGRSDHVLSATPAELDYDPVARLRGINSGIEEEDIMLFRVRDGGDRTGAPEGSDAGAVYLATADGPRWITGGEWGSVGAQQPMLCDSYARILELCPPRPAATPVQLTPTPEQWASLTAAIADKVGTALSPSKLKAGTLEAFREIGANIPPAA